MKSKEEQTLVMALEEALEIAESAVDTITLGDALEQMIWKETIAELEQLREYLEFVKRKEGMK